MSVETCKRCGETERPDDGDNWHPAMGHVNPEVCCVRLEAQRDAAHELVARMLSTTRTVEQRIEELERLR